MRLVFVRHAESTANAEARLQGHAEFELSGAGRAQAECLRDRFEAEGFQPTHIYSSPQRRTAETTRIVSRLWTLAVTCWDELMEHDIGIFSGLTWREIEERYPDLAHQFQVSRDWDLVQGAETLAQRRARARSVVETVIQKHANEDVVLLFTHGGILQHMLDALMGTERTWGMNVRNTGVFDFSLDLERWRLNGNSLLNTSHWQIRHFNDASHLLSA
jgi:broad specificity phosphatase PhoE